LARKEKERKRKGGEGSVKKRNGADMGGVYQGPGSSLSPHGGSLS